MKRLHSMLLSSLVFGALVFGVVGGLAPRYHKTPTSHPAAAAVDDYYSGITATRGNELLAQVRDLTVKNHKNYNGYDCLGKLLWQKVIDSEDGGETVRDFYSHAKMAPAWNPNQVYNREHVWPKACSNNIWDEAFAGADAHHIRPEFNPANGKRSNHPFGVVPAGTAVLKHTYNGVAYSYGYLSGDIFEPMDLAKGDVARIVLYVFMHYNKPETLKNNTYPTSSSNIGSAVSQGSGNLPITNVISAPGGKQKAFELLVEWNQNDPPDDLERLRNDELVKSSRTGTRNPFIDHPEYVNAIWGDGSLTLPPSSDKESVTVAPVSRTIKVGETFTLTAIPENFEHSVSYAWSSNKKSVATVDGSTSNQTVVTGHAKGQAVITVTATDKVDGTKSASASCTVTVKEETVSPPVTPPAAGEAYKIIDLTNHSGHPKTNHDYNVEVSVGDNPNVANDVTAKYKGGSNKDGEWAYIKLGSIRKDTGELWNGEVWTTQLIDAKIARIGVNIMTKFAHTKYATPDKFELYTATNAASPAWQSEPIATLTPVTPSAENFIEIPADKQAENQVYKIVLRLKTGSTSLDPAKDKNKNGVIQVDRINFYMAVYELAAFNSDFLSIVECDGTGNTPPAKDNWSTMKAKYEILRTEDKTVLQTADISHDVVGPAVERYDFIIRKYGATEYENFMERNVQAQHALASIDPDRPLIVITMTAVLLLTSLTALGLLVHRKMRQSR